MPRSLPTIGALRQLLNQESMLPTHENTYADIFRALNRAKIPEDVKFQFGRPDLPEQSQSIFNMEDIGEYPRGYLAPYVQPITTRGRPEALKGALSSRSLQGLLLQAKAGAKSGRHAWYDLDPVKSFMEEEIAPENLQYAQRLLKMGPPFSQQTSVPAEFLSSAHVNEAVKRGGWNDPDIMYFSQFGGGASPQMKLANAQRVMEGGEDIPTHVKLNSYGQNREGNLFPATVDSKILRVLGMDEQTKAAPKGAAGALLKAYAARTGVMPAKLQAMLWGPGEGAVATKGAEEPLAATINNLLYRSAYKQGIDPKKHAIDVFSGDASIPFKAKELGYAEGGLAALAKYVNSKIPREWRGKMEPMPSQGTGRTVFNLQPDSGPPAVAKILGEEPRGILEQQFHDNYLEKHGRVPKRFWESPDAEITLEERIPQTDKRVIRQFLQPMTAEYGRAIAEGHQFRDAHKTHAPLTSLMQQNNLGDFLNFDLLGGDFFGTSYPRRGAVPITGTAEQGLTRMGNLRTPGGRIDIDPDRIHPAIRHWATRDGNIDDKVLLDQGALIPDLVRRGTSDIGLKNEHKKFFDRRLNWLLNQDDILQQSLNPVGMQFRRHLGDVPRRELYEMFNPEAAPEGFGLFARGGSLNRAREAMADGGVVRNWLRGVKGSGIDEALTSLKNRYQLNLDDKEVAKTIKHYEEQIAQNVNVPFLPATREALAGKKKALAMRDWVDKNLGNYIVKQMGTEADPLATSGIGPQIGGVAQRMLEERPNAPHALRAVPLQSLIRQIKAAEIPNKVWGYTTEGMENPFNPHSIKPGETYPTGRHESFQVPEHSPPWLTKLIEQDAPRYWSQKQYDAMQKQLSNRTDSILTGDTFPTVESQIAAGIRANRKPAEERFRVTGSYGDDSALKYQSLFNEEKSRQAALHEEKYQRRHTPPVILHDIDKQAWRQYMEPELRGVMDWLRQTDTPPERLSRVSVPQAFAGAKAWHEALAKKKAEMLGDPWLGTKVHKEYPTGHKWVEFDPSPRVYDPPLSLEESANTPDVGDAIKEALKREGDQMGHCVGGYCDDVIGGHTKIFSLRDPKGYPHVTVEVQPGEAAYKKYAEGQPDQPANIVQIKGKGNKAPIDEYKPFVQDFIRSGKWGEVNELDNAGLYKHSKGDQELTRGNAMSDVYHFLGRNRESIGQRTIPHLGSDRWIPAEPHLQSQEYWSPQELWKLLYEKPEGFASGGTVQGGEMDLAKSMESWFNEAEAKYSLPPALIRSIAKHESNFDPKALSKKGAIGIMQWMGDSAKKPGFGIEGFTPGKDIRTDILKAGEYLKALHDKHGDWGKALGSYNWGTGNVATYGMDKAPKETKSYVDSILKSIQPKEIPPEQPSFHMPQFTLEDGLSTLPQDEGDDDNEELAVAWLLDLLAQSPEEAIA